MGSPVPKSNERIESLLRQAKELAEIECEIILADREFDGDSEHASPKDRLIASIERLRTKAELADLRADPGQESLMQGYGIGLLHKWAHSPEAGFKSIKSRDNFLKHLNRAYAHFRELSNVGH
jgi:hypothetical protein